MVPSPLKPLLHSPARPGKFIVRIFTFNPHVGLRIAERHAGGNSDDLSVVGDVALSPNSRVDGVRLSHPHGSLYPQQIGCCCWADPASSKFHQIILHNHNLTGPD